jgi:hypothetical protein
MKEGQILKKASKEKPCVRRPSRPVPVCVRGSAPPRLATSPRASTLVALIILHRWAPERVELPGVLLFADSFCATMEALGALGGLAASAVCVGGACFGAYACAGAAQNPNVKELQGRMGKTMRALESRYQGQDREKFALRGDDVVVAVPGKSGTTWLMHIAHQVRMKGATPDFDDQMDVIPWIDPHGPALAIPEDIDRPQCAKPRVFKSHAPYKAFTKGGLAEGGKLIYCFRDLYAKTHARASRTRRCRPGSALLPLCEPARYDMRRHTCLSLTTHGCPLAAALLFERRADVSVSSWKFLPPMFGFSTNDPEALDHIPLEAWVEAQLSRLHDSLHNLCDWWEQRNDPRVLLLFFDDMKLEHEVTVRKVAAFMCVGRALPAPLCSAGCCLAAVWLLSGCCLSADATSRDDLSSFDL